MALCFKLVLLAASCHAAVGQPPENIHHPDPKAAEDNAFAIFNEIHSAMRQFGSSVHHNGLSFYLAQAPEGSAFYHGDYISEIPPNLEWLAFEFEHAEIFAESWEPSESSNISSYMYDTDPLLQHRMSRRLPSVYPEADRSQDGTSSQHPLVGLQDDNDSNHREPGIPYWPDLSKFSRGYLQTYIANRPLNLLYIAGESAAKCEMGPMDSQDYILMDKTSFGPKNPFRGEITRSTELCALAQEWKFEAGGKIDGFIRMEAGFEIIYCDFFDGLDLLSVHASPFRNETGIEIDSSVDFMLGIDAKMLRFEWMRAVAARFHGHPAGRLEVDWSSMVSAFAYPVNLTNPDGKRQDLHRVAKVERDDRMNIRDRLREVVFQRGGRSVIDKGVVNWQSVVDKIVTRFSERLWWMGNTALSLSQFIVGIGTLINPFIDYTDHSPKAEQLAIERCTQHYFDPHILHRDNWTPEDDAIVAAVSAVSRTICTSLFSAREILRSNTTTAGIEEGPAVTETARGVLQELIANLRWSTWRECGNCGLDELCSIPMFPMGSEEDYFHPRCKNITDVLSGQNYWNYTAHW